MAKTLIASWSETDTARQCFMKHDISYRERWRQTGPESPALQRGTIWHGGLEIHYNRIMAWQQAGKPIDAMELLDEIRAEVVVYFADVAPSDEELDVLTWMYDGHVDLYSIDEQWKILGVEVNREVWLPTPNGGRSRFKMKMKMDLIVKDLLLGGMWIVDHKSGKDLPKGKDLDFSDQFGLYQFGMRQLGHQIRGTVYSAARTHRNKDQKRYPQPLSERFSRTPMPRSDIELEQIAVEAYKTLTTAYGYKPGEAPRSPNPDTCKWKCDYTEPCLLARRGMDRTEALRGFNFIQDFTRH